MSEPVIEPTRAAALEFLTGRIDYERSAVDGYTKGEFRLDRMRELLARLANPERRLTIVHVAGTKGKGSTSAMIAAMLTAAKIKTGLYTSPHLLSIEERFVVDGLSCTSRQLVDLTARVRTVAQQMDQAEAARDGSSGTAHLMRGATYFELTTAIALLHFVQSGCQVAVLEVGLGGRLDSTNVCQPAVSVITSISFDHTRQLGSTLAAIAGEKAGIIKPGVPVVCGVLNAEAQAVIHAVAAPLGCAVIQLGDDFWFDYRPARHAEAEPVMGRLDLYTQRDAPATFKEFPLRLLGQHQARNASVALATVLELRRQGWSIPDAAVRRGLAEASMPARVEVIQRQPTVILDAAHNVASVESLLKTLDESFPANDRALVFGTTQEKDVRGMLQLLLPRFESVYLTRYTENPRSVNIEELTALAGELGFKNHQAFDRAEDAYREAVAAAGGAGTVCITGSFFLAAELRRHLAPSEGLNAAKTQSATET